MMYYSHRVRFCKFGYGWATKNSISMTKKSESGGKVTKGGGDSTLSPTVVQVIDQFVAAMRADADIPNEAIDRLEKILRKEGAPKPDDINTTLFGPSPDNNA